jgi:hypothetical protein
VGIGSTRTGTLDTHGDTDGTRGDTARSNQSGHEGVSAGPLRNVSGCCGGGNVSQQWMDEWKLCVVVDVERSVKRMEQMVL